MTENRIETYGFGRANLYIAVVSLLLIVVGYALLGGGASEDGVTFNETTFSAVRIKVAPIVLTIGYLGLLPAVLLRSKSKAAVEQPKETH